MQTIENLPNTLMEAMATGIPIICSNKGPMPELLDAESALFFNPNDVDDIKKSIRKLIENPDLQNSIRSNSLNASQSFSWRTNVRKTAEFIEELLA